jgi:hypothetical protein
VQRDIRLFQIRINPIEPARVVGGINRIISKVGMEGLINFGEMEVVFEILPDFIRTSIEKEGSWRGARRVLYVLNKIKIAANKGVNLRGETGVPGRLKFNSSRGVLIRAR